MVNPIPDFVRNIWSKWNIRAVILTSLFLQIVLIFLAPLRKRTKKRLVTMLLWSTYLLADYTANFCVGLISNKYGDQETSTSNINDFVLAFWAPFLLLHLGGPDTITAFALEDNELWLRHMLGLIVQGLLTSYVFVLSLPANTLWIPTVLVFLAGIIKFAERTRSLQRASISNFRQSMTRKPDPGPNYAKLMEEYKSRKDVGLPTKIVTMPEPNVDVDTAKMPEEPNDGVGNEKQPPSNFVEKLDDVDVVGDAYYYFDKFKGLIVDMIFSFHERNESREYFVKLKAMDALRVIEVELNFIYEAFYTKASVVRNKVGYIFRFAAVVSVVVALVLFVFDQKHGCNEFDVKVTYMLLYGAVALDLVSLLMLVFSDDTFASFKNCFSGIRIFAGSIFEHFLKLKRPKWQEKPNMKGKFLCRRALFRRWSGSISRFNLLSYTLHKRVWWWVDKIIDYLGAKEFVEQWKYEKKKPLLQELWVFIFEELERKSADADDVETIQRICSSRGAWVIQECGRKREDIGILMPYVDANTVTFDQSLILWHIATDLMFYEDEDKEGGGDVEKKSVENEIDQDAELQRYFSKLLSDYMLYLLIMQPTMMSAVRGIGQIRFQDTCAEATKFFEKRYVMEEKDQEKNVFSKLLDSIETFWKMVIDLLKEDTCKKLHESTKKLISGINQSSEDAEEKRFEKKKKACERLILVCTEQEPSSIKGDRSKSLLFDACRLANEFKNLKEKNKWKMIAQVWVELLSFAACNCRPITHVQQLSQGGEFISLVWLLMTHLGLAKQFQIKEGHARAKLIVGEEDNIKSS